MKKKISQIGIFKKLGMSRIFEKGADNSQTASRIMPVTILELAPAYVLSVDKTEQKAEISCHIKKKINQPTQAKLKKAHISLQLAKSFKCPVGEQFSLQPGERLDINQFNVNEKITAVSRSKGKGFSGVIKRHGFSRGPETHGSHHHRQPGSIGSMFPQRVIAGKKMPGRSGGFTTTVKNLRVLDIDKEKNLLIVAGSIPGPNRGEVIVFK